MSDACTVRHAVAAAALCLALSGCTLLQGRPADDAGSARGESADAATATSTRITLLDRDDHATAIERRKAELVATAAEPLPAAEAGYYMDLQEANLRQHLNSGDARIARRGDRIEVVLAGPSGFDTGETELDTAMDRILSNVARVLTQYPMTFVAVHAHTDPEGATEYNQRLSEQRALRVARHLADAGVDIDRLAALGHGESRPETHRMSRGRTIPSRRIEIHLEPMAEPSRTGARDSADAGV